MNAYQDNCSYLKGSTKTQESQWENSRGKKWKQKEPNAEEEMKREAGEGVRKLTQKA